MFLWPFKSIPLRKFFNQKICLRKKFLLEGLPLARDISNVVQIEALLKQYLVGLLILFK